MRLPIVIALAIVLVSLAVFVGAAFDFGGDPIPSEVKAFGPTMLPPLPTATPRPQFNPLLVSNSYAFVPDCSMPIPLGITGLSLRIIPSGPCDIFVADSYLSITAKTDGSIYELSLQNNGVNSLFAGSEDIPVLPTADCGYLLNVGVILAGVTLNGTGYFGPCQVLSAPNFVRMSTQQGIVIELRRIIPFVAAFKTSAPTPTPAPSICSTELIYIVAYGNNLASIARQFGADLNTLVARNALTTDVIQPGQQLVIPARC